MLANQDSLYRRLSSEIDASDTERPPETIFTKTLETTDEDMAIVLAGALLLT